MRPRREPHGEVQPAALTLREPLHRDPARVPVDQPGGAEPERRSRPHALLVHLLCGPPGRPRGRLLQQRRDPRRPQHADSAGGRAQGPGEQADERRLAGPVGAGDEELVAAPHLEGDRRGQAPLDRHLVAAQQGHRSPGQVREGEPWRRGRHRDPVRLERREVAVEGAHQARRPGLALVLAGALVGPPAGAEPGARLMGRLGEAAVLVLLGEVVALPAGPGPGPLVAPRVVAPGLEVRAPVLARVEVEELLRHVAQQGPVVADQHQPAAVAGQPVGEKGQTTVVEVVGRLVEEQEVGRRAEQAGEPDPVALAHRQRGERTVAVGARLQGIERDVDAAVGVPGVEPGGVIERLGVRLVGVRGAVGQRGRGGVEAGQRPVCRGEGLADERADRLAVPAGHRLAGEPEGADAVDVTLVRRQHAGKHVEQRGLAAAVLAHERQARPRGHGQVEVAEEAAAAEGDAEPLGADLRAVTRGQVQGRCGWCGVRGHGDSPSSSREPGSTESPPGGGPGRRAGTRGVGAPPSGDEAEPARHRAGEGHASDVHGDHASRAGAWRHPGFRPARQARTPARGGCAARRRRSPRRPCGRGTPTTAGARAGRARRSRWCARRRRAPGSRRPSCRSRTPRRRCRPR